MLQAGSLFDRDVERAALQDYLLARPTSILVLLGPQSCGKTALLKDVLLKGKLADSPFPPMYLDGRQDSVSNAGMFVSLLQSAGRSVTDMLLAKLSRFSNSSIGQALANVTDKVAPVALVSISVQELAIDFFKKELQTINDVIRGVQRLAGAV